MKSLETDFTQELRSAGISPSPQRLAVYSFLKKHPVHPTADAIFRELRPELPTLSLTTVYNTLKLFVRQGVIQEVIIEDGELRFDADLREHAHFKCTACSRVYDLFPAPGESVLAKLPALPPAFTVAQTHVCLRGKCAACHGL